MVKGPFFQIFLGGGGGAYTWTNICILKTLFFVQAIVFFRFSAHNLSLLLIFLLFSIFNNVLTTVSTTNIAITILQKPIGYQIQYSVFGFFPPKFNVMFEFNYSKYNPWGLFSGGAGGGGAYTWKEFSVSKVGSWMPRGLYTVGLIIGILRYLFNIKVQHNGIKLSQWMCQNQFI